LGLKDGKIFLMGEEEKASRKRFRDGDNILPPAPRDNVPENFIKIMIIEYI
jgi:hypothetical protein